MFIFDTDVKFWYNGQQFLILMKWAGSEGEPTPTGRISALADLVAGGASGAFTTAAFLQSHSPELMGKAADASLIFFLAMLATFVIKYFTWKELPRALPYLLGVGLGAGLQVAAPILR